jgi:hypothetical protein
LRRLPGEPTRSAAVVDSDITFIVTYRCPTCQAALEARTSEAHTWLRCPKCGRASLPPEYVRTPPPRRHAPGEDILVIGPDAVDPRRAVSESAHSGSGRRIAMAVGMLISVGMLIVSFLDGNPTNVGIFGVTTIVLLAIAAYLGRGR